LCGYVRTALLALQHTNIKLFKSTASFPCALCDNWRLCDTPRCSCQCSLQFQICHLWH